MGNYIIIGAVLVALVVALRSTIRHFKGEGGCCGDGGYTSKKKKLSGILYKKAFTVEGMHCKHCKRRVEEAVNDIEGVSGRVILGKGVLIVSYAKEVDDEKLCECIEKAGYAGYIEKGVVKTH